MRRPEVARVTGLAGPLLAWQLAAGLFPPPVRPGVWCPTEVAAVVAARAGGVSDEGIRGIVRGLIADRAQPEGGSCD